MALADDPVQPTVADEAAAHDGRTILDRFLVQESWLNCHKPLSASCGAYGGADVCAGHRRTLVLEDVLVGPLVTDMVALLSRQPAADLLRVPVLAQNTLDPLPDLLRDTWRALRPASLLIQSLHLLWIVATQALVAPNLTADHRDQLFQYADISERLWPDFMIASIWYLSSWVSSV